MTETSENDALFAGVRIIAVTRAMSGPFAAYQFALHGADVITIEETGRGDYVRYIPYAYGGDITQSVIEKKGMGTGFLAQNANKRSLALNLKDPRGRDIFRTLAARSDVVLENLRTGAMARQGLGYEDLRQINPRLIFCSITGYGQTGPKKTDPGIDGALQAASGMMSITGTRAGGPMKAGFPIIDYSTGYAASLAIASALYKREKTGKGQAIDVSMMEVALAMMSSHVTEALTRGRAPALNGNRTGRSYVNTALKCKDGVILIAASQDEMRTRLYEAIGRTDIPADPRFATPAACRENIDVLEQEVEKTLMTRPAQEWEDILNKAGVAAMRVRSVSEAALHPQVQGRGFMHTFDTTAALGLNVTVPLSPYRLSDYPAQATRKPPAHGEHTDEILGEIGFSPQEIAALHAAGVV